jgi:ribonuclease-3
LNIFIKKRRDSKKEIAKFLKNGLGIRPKNLDIYQMAFTHASASTKNIVHTLNNERLEYLGDAILNAVVADYLFKKYPLCPEGQLTEMRSKIVCRNHLNKLSKKMRLTEFIVIEPKCNPRSLDGDTFEALIGALYLDKGYKKTQKIIINKMFLTLLDIDYVLQEEHNYKSKLLNWAQKKNYKVRFENHEVGNTKGRKLFVSLCYLNNECIAEAEDFKVKMADQLAAEKACRKLHLTS